ncbi:unnamed protein product [Brassicogethes aeneus]|uniref:Uncharacterized protein n=1 Tax=Brassicogethes aeneus TaxID=1431903 RepID=A0A9P0ATU0_BRAAE|nr:unnamed protein product [Brassicogethes aeneus]
MQAGLSSSSDPEYSGSSSSLPEDDGIRNFLLAERVADFIKTATSYFSSSISGLAFTTPNFPFFLFDLLVIVALGNGEISDMLGSLDVKGPGKDEALKWPKKLNLISKSYQGDLFEGNACRKLLENPDSLLACGIVFNGEKTALHLVPIIESLKAFDKIVEMCFSSKRKCSFDEILKSIDRLKKTYAATNLSYTLKIHIIIEHLEECLRHLDNSEGLGLWSEQPGESLHREFIKTWKKYKINDIDNPNYERNLAKAVVEYSSLHL